jgi:CRISPR system Cascade subunit CasC
MRTFVEIHVLQNFAPSNLNRDDTGAPKDAFFGGTRRARVSSQCLKRAVREFFKDKAKAGEISPDDLGERSKRFLNKVAKLIPDRNPQEVVERTRLAMLAGSGTWVAPAEGSDEQEKSEYLLFLGNREVAAIAATINSRWDLEKWEEIRKALEKNSVKDKKKEAGKKASKELKDAFAKLLDGGKAVDVALFGRMLADMPENNQNAACQVAHAISTHAVEREFDFYTAVDDLKPEDTAGADMMGTVEFNSACFYRYAVVDWAKLTENLQEDIKLATKGLSVFLEGFILAEPTGKQNTFAAHNPPEFVAITVRQGGAPRNLANAFEKPVRVKTGESLTKTSAEVLIEKAKALGAAFDGKAGKKSTDDNADKKSGDGDPEMDSGSSFVLNLVEANTAGFGTKKSSLTELLSAVTAKISNTPVSPAGA